MGAIGAVLLLVCVALWITAFWLVRKWRLRNRFLSGNVVVLFLCQTLIWTANIVETRHDRYGYSIIFASVFFFLFHTAAAFALGVYFNLSINNVTHKNADGQNLTE
ncbi:hypothetical protein [Flavobacterium selenitireducens]|uniref:hypothetical protein n=1 Tax=Flavobacterium selenitireducens TaxID=2722704 RepID=UPI00168A4B00|nr:hypothetical protein [Flavobacterium selenitireducens]MBD3581467.1 hypothetical protein [Flavobacterium selenitireducens]